MDDWIYKLGKGNEDLLTNVLGRVAGGMVNQKWLCVTKLERVWNNHFLWQRRGEGGNPSVGMASLLNSPFIKMWPTMHILLLLWITNFQTSGQLAASLHRVWKSTYLPENVDLACGNIKHTLWWKFPNQIILMLSFPALCQILSSDLVNNLLPVHSKFPDGGTSGIYTWKPLFARIDRRISIQTIKTDS